MNKKVIPCKFEDWDDTTFPRPTCECTNDDIPEDYCGCVPNDVVYCPGYQPAHLTPHTDRKEG